MGSRPLRFSPCRVSKPCQVRTRKHPSWVQPQSGAESHLHRQPICPATYLMHPLSERASTLENPTDSIGDSMSYYSHSTPAYVADRLVQPTTGPGTHATHKPLSIESTKCRVRQIPSEPTALVDSLRQAFSLVKLH